MRIYKNEALFIAQKLTKHIKDEADLVNTKLQEYVKNALLFKIPLEILILFNDAELKEYINKQYSFTISLVGSKRLYFNFDECIPYYKEHLIMDHEESAEIIKLQDSYKQLSDKYDNALIMIQNTLLSLGTYKRIEEAFPEVAVYLNKKEKLVTALSVPINEIRLLIKK